MSTQARHLATWSLERLGEPVELGLRCLAPAESNREVDHDRAVGGHEL
jgi:hypothetical protein